MAEFFRATHSPTPDCAIWWTEPEPPCSRCWWGSLAPLEGEVDEAGDEDCEEAEVVEAGEEREAVAVGWRGWTRKLFCRVQK